MLIKDSGMTVRVVCLGYCLVLAACADAPVSTTASPSVSVQSEPAPAPEVNSSNPLNGITTIAFDPVVAPGEQFFLTAGQLWTEASSAIGGPVMVGIAASQAHTDSQNAWAELKPVLNQNHIDIPSMLVEQMRSALGRSGRFSVVDGGADAMLSVAMSNYGLAVRSGFTNKLSAVLRFKVTLTDKNGQVVYLGEFSERNAESTRFSPEELKEDPERIGAAFTDTASRAGTVFAGALVRFSKNPDAKAPVIKKKAVSDNDEDLDDQK